MMPNVTTQIQRTTSERYYMRSDEAPMKRLRDEVPPAITSANLLLALSSRLADVPNLQLTVSDWGENYQAIARVDQRGSMIMIDHRRAGESVYLDMAASGLRARLEQGVKPA